MTFAEVSDSVVIQPPAGGVTFTASGNIYKGQAVYLVDNYTVKSPSTNDNIMYGIAAYNTLNGEKVTVYGVGNIVKCKISSSSALSAGTKVGCIAGGFISDVATYCSGAIITKAPSTNYGDGEILILGHSYQI